MEKRFYSEKDYKVSPWAGGNTVQIAIGPEDACYGNRDFLWRLSSATVELEESLFTALPDYDRFICALDGRIEIQHDQDERRVLDPFAVHFFDGGRETVSFGRCTDFNLMLRKGRVCGHLEALELSEGVWSCDASHAVCDVLLYDITEKTCVHFHECGGERLCAEISHHGMYMIAEISKDRQR